MIIEVQSTDQNLASLKLTANNCPGHDSGNIVIADATKRNIVNVEIIIVVKIAAV